MLAAGLALWGWSLVLFKGKGVPFNPPRELVVAGPYAWARNPMLTGVFSTLLGLGFILNSVSLVFLGTPAFVALNVIVLKILEEPELERRFGAIYTEYKQRVPTFVPRRHGKRGGGAPPNNQMRRTGAAQATDGRSRLAVITQRDGRFFTQACDFTHSDALCIAKFNKLTVEPRGIKLA